MNESTQAINSSNWMVAAKNTVSYLWLGVEAAKAGKMRFQVICEVPQLPFFLAHVRQLLLAREAMPCRHPFSINDP